MNYDWTVTLSHLADWLSGDPLWLKCQTFLDSILEKNAFGKLNLPPLLMDFVASCFRGRRCRSERCSYVSLTDNLAEIAQTLRGPRGLPGQGRRGPPGEPGEIGPPGLNSTTLKGLLGFSVPHFSFSFLSLAGCNASAIPFHVFFFPSFSARSRNFPSLQEVPKRPLCSAAGGSHHADHANLHPLIHLLTISITPVFSPATLQPTLLSDNRGC